VLPVAPVADNRVSPSERTATTVQVRRSASMFSAASLAIWMDVHICAPFQLRSAPTLQLQVDLANFAYLPDATSSLARSRCAIMHSLAILMFDSTHVNSPAAGCLRPRARPHSNAAELTPPPPPGRTAHWAARGAGVKAGVHGSCMAADRGNCRVCTVRGVISTPDFRVWGGGMPVISATQRAPRVPVRRRQRSFVVHGRVSAVHGKRHVLCLHRQTLTGLRQTPGRLRMRLESLVTVSR
jgi:hypothetical protein